MPRFLNRSIRFALDLGVISLGYWLAWLFRFEFRIPVAAAHIAAATWPFSLGIQVVALVAFGVHRIAWSYVSIRDATQVLLALVASTITLFTLRLALLLPHTNNTIPLSVIAMDFVLILVGLIGVRAAYRIHREHQNRKGRVKDGSADRVVLIGAGEAGMMVARELANRPDLGLIPVGFLDDDKLKLSTRIGGLPVLGTVNDIGRIAEQMNVKLALIAIARATGAEIRRITALCSEAGIETRIIPGMHEIVGGKVNLSRVREVAIEDLLGREPVKLDEEIVSTSLRSRVVLVTGAGGSIGSELCRQICRFGPERLILIERFENALFEIHRELASMFPHVPIDPKVADVCDEARIRTIFEQCKPAIVFHAAAHKHVPMMEWNPGEAVKNNIGGTRIVASISDEHRVERFVLVSTDKAVNPTSVMGATKRVAEIYLQAFSQRSSTRFVTVRFGNVLGSAGSVIPIFRGQIARGGPVEVTHPDMRRYFMTIPEACQLVMQAGAMGRGGEIFILDMGEPVRIVDLARDLIILSGLRPDEDIEIRFSGIRPGEKLFEELSTDAEQAEKTRHPKIFIGRIKPHEWDDVREGIQTLFEAAMASSAEEIRAALATLIPEYARAFPATSAKTTSPRGERALPESVHAASSAESVRN